MLRLGCHFTQDIYTIPNTKTVSTDQEQAKKTTFYIYKGAAWVAVGGSVVACSLALLLLGLALLWLAGLVLPSCACVLSLVP